MRFKINFNRTTRQRMLPMDYQYYVSAWVYKVLRQADREFARFLHERGYGQSDTKLYKLFCFSRLNFGKPVLWKERKLFEISRHEISLLVSFDVPEAASTFVKGLFVNQEFFLGDKFNGIDLKVSGVEVLPEPAFRTTMHYRLQTPWVVSCQAVNDRNPQYLSPADDGFDQLAIKHLLEKYKNTRNAEDIGPEQVGLKRRAGFKRAGFVIKPGTPAQTRVVGNLFDFELTAPVELHRMIWSAGVGEKSASGFGWVELSPVGLEPGLDRNSRGLNRNRRELHREGGSPLRNACGLDRNTVGSHRNAPGSERNERGLDQNDN